MLAPARAVTAQVNLNLNDPTQSHYYLPKFQGSCRRLESFALASELEQIMHYILSLCSSWVMVRGWSTPTHPILAQ
jgi:hypothetical protein